MAAGRSYTAAEASGSREETPHVRGQGWLGGDTPLPRSGGPREVTLCPRPGVVTLGSHPEPEARGGSWKEPPMQPRPGATAGRSNWRSGG